MNLKKDRETRHKEMRNYISEHRRVFIIYMLPMSAFHYNSRIESFRENV